MKKKRVLKSESVKKEFNCDICKKTGFSTMYKLRAHLFLHRAIPARYKCDFCSKEYYRSDEYSRHLAVHNKSQKMHYCDHCERGFVDKRNLIIHLTIHDDLPISPTRYKCNTCGANYCEERLLKYHIRKEHLKPNTSEPIQIKKDNNEMCIGNVKGSKNFTEITNINSDATTNTKDKRKINNKNDKLNDFQQYMASVFATKDNYYSKAICDYCGKEMLKKSIVGHIRERHFKLRRFNCDVCRKTFMRHYQLCLHICGKERRRRKIKPS